MTAKFVSSLAALGMVLILTATGGAQDMRARQVDAKAKRAILLEKSIQEKHRAEKEADETKQKILTNKTLLKKEIAGLKKAQKEQTDKNLNLKNRIKELESEQITLRQQKNEAEGDMRELLGFIRISAKEIAALISRSLQSALTPDREAPLKPILDEKRFPGMDDICAIVEILFDEITRSGEVRIEEGSFVNRSGEETSGEILILGNFTAAYRQAEETGFLLYSDKGRRLLALSKLPNRKTAKALRVYMEGKSENVPLDISKGAALRQLTHRPNLMARIAKGGPIVWPILGIAVLALLIILERSLYLIRKDMGAGRLANMVCKNAALRKWDRCCDLCKRGGKKPIPGMLLAGINNRTTGREEMENVLHEAILNEIPKLERFLSTLGMLAAISPLLGLLGTVTGMINTFHVITYFGAGDPKMMSGGISEALVTTMLGLSVAIPITC